MEEVRLDSLPVGSSFELVLETTGRRIPGKVLRVTPCSCVVKLDTGTSTREFTRINPKSGEEEVVRIPVPSTIEHWDCGTPVVVRKEGT
jgi:hypothetical protein